MVGERSQHTITSSPLLYPLHIALAAIFAFVLPFICWGALATPGHPHGLPHFVFFAPQSPHAAHAIEYKHVDAANTASVAGESVDAQNEPDAPVAQSVASILGVALLAPILLLLAALLQPSALRFMRRQAETFFSSFIQAPNLPPPRQTVTLLP